MNLSELVFWWGLHSQRVIAPDIASCYEYTGMFGIPTSDLSMTVCCKSLLNPKGAHHIKYIMAVGVFIRVSIRWFGMKFRVKL